MLQDIHGNVEATHSVSAGLDYAAIGPEHAALHASGRAQYEYAGDADALEAFQALARTEGIIPALESAHAFAYLLKAPHRLAPGTTVLVNLSGRGDKDVQSVAALLPEGHHVSHQ